MQKNTLTLFCAAIMACAIVGVPLPTLSPEIGWGRLTYSFAHANVFHAAVNVYVFWQICSRFHVSAARLFVAFVIAITVPPVFISTPAVGLSAVIYALFGLIIPFVARKRYYICYVLLFILPQIVIPHIAWHLHLFAFLTGLALACPESHQ